MKIRKDLVTDPGKAGGQTIVTDSLKAAIADLGKFTLKDMREGDVKFYTNDLPALPPPASGKEAAYEARQVDGNMARCIYGWTDAETLDRVGVNDRPRAGFSGQQGGVACYERPHTGQVDRHSGGGKFFYVYMVGPIDATHPDDVTIQIGH